MAKAYDRMSWVFIIRVLRRFAFGKRFIDIVWRLLSNVWFSVLVNGVPYGFFKSSRGLQQGNSLSPALFIIGAEVLSRGLNLLYFQSNFVGYKVPRHCPTISHLAFADDIIIFANGSASSLKKIMLVLELYQKALGQLMNTSKSGFLLHPSVLMARQGIIERVTKFSRRGFPIRYLELPLYTGKCKGSYFADLSQRMVDKVLSWKIRLLLSGWKIILIKHVLSSIPIYLLAAGVMPKNIFHMTEQVCANFLWGTTKESRRFHWVGWRDLCFPLEEGGIGFRSIDDTYRAFSCKLRWTFRQNLSLWAMFMRAKYCHDTHPYQVALRSPSSVTWLRMLDIREFVELFILWRPYSDFCHFWYDNWTVSGALYLRADVQDHLSFHDFIVCGTWDSRLLSHVILLDLVQVVVSMPIPCISSVHKMVWTTSSSGSFSLSSTLQELRQAKPSSFMLSQVWHPHIPLKISFMMRLLRGRLPLDDILTWYCVHLSSKCFCCLEPSVEMLQHVFISGDVAKQLMVESDSLVLIKILRNDDQCPWTISYEIEQCCEFSQGSIQFKHCYREANKVADVLANVGCALVESEVMQSPITAADGFTYKEAAIRAWLDGGQETSPMMNLSLEHQNLVPNPALRSAIQEWMESSA
ncbi:uncharacterized protein [Coffea arabica]|uniref:Uncharacterized protein n=1 Tax=Coffea arabica TaxID=13443 RepID=A0A6P6S9Y5_COFAR|nr:uncharacterized protein LOC113689373 [Coffea arabica]